MEQRNGVVAASLIRPERVEERHAAESMIRNAFWNLYKDKPEEELVEHYLLHAAREIPTFDPRLNLVAVDGGEIVGHVLCLPAKIVADDAVAHEVLTLGPLAVAPSRQRQGIGTALVNAVAEQAESLGFRAIVLLGEPEFYSQIGFIPGSRYGVRMAEFDAGDYLQVRELRPGGMDGVSGKYVDALLPLVDAKAIKEFDATFPPLAAAAS